MKNKAGIIKSEWRNETGSFASQELKKLSHDIENCVVDIYKKYNGIISYDAMHQFICDSSSFERMKRIAFEV